MRGAPALLVAAAAAACGGAVPAGRWAETDGAWTLPLVAAWRPRLLLVEGEIAGSGPYLVALDTGRPGGAIAAEVARALGLPGANDPTLRHPVRVPRLALGGLVLEDVALAVEPGEALAELHGRPVAVALGTHLFAPATVEVDRAAGVVRVWLGQDPPDPETAPRVALARTGRRPPWTVAAEVGEGTPDGLLLATGEPTTRLTRATAEAAGLPPPAPRSDAGDGAAAAWLAPVALLGLPPRPLPIGILDDPAPGVAGVLGLDALDGWSFRLDGPGDRLLLWRAAPRGAHLARHPATAGCGPDLAACVAGRVEAVQPGRVTLSFGAPAAVLPPGWWARVDLGRPGAPRTVLVRPQPPRPVETRVDVDAAGLSRGTVRPPGSAVDVVDVLPLGLPCGGELCTSW